MKAIAIEQPWASLIVSGMAVPGIENGDVIGLYSSEVLVYALPAPGDFAFDALPLRVALPVTNLENTGVIENVGHLPYNAVVGVVTLNTDSAQGDEKPSRFRFSNGRAFARPVFDIEAGRGLFEVDAISEDDLPAFKERNIIERDGTTLRLPVSRSFFNRALRRGTAGVHFVLNLLNDNFFLFCTKNLEPKDTRRVVLLNEGRRLVAAVTGYECYEVCAEDIEDIDYRDNRRRRCRWSQVNITLG